MVNRKSNIAALYLRLSREDSLEGDSYSIQNQQKLLEDAAAKEGYTTKVYADDGISGTVIDRPEYQRMSADIEQGKLSAVFVKDLSRLGRDYLEVGLFIKKCVDFNDVRIIAVSDAFDSKEGVDLISVALKNVINESYAQDISKKRRLVNDLKAKTGIPLGKPPYGYMKNPDNVKPYWVVDEEAARIVEQIFDEYVDDKGTAQIAADLEAEGVPTPMNYALNKGLKKGGKRSEKASKWNSTTIIKILGLREYTGDLVNCKTFTKSYKNKRQYKNDKPLVFENAHEEIIPHEKWEQVQEKRRKIKKRKTITGERNMFSGLLICADCGGKLGFHFNQKNHDIKYFNCTAYNKRHRECSTSHYVRADFLERVVLGEIKRLTKFVSMYSETFETAVRGYAQDKTEFEIKRMEKDLKTAQNRSNDIDVIIQKLYEDNVCGKISDDRFATMNAQYEQEQAELSDRITALQAEIQQEAEKARTVDVFIEAVKKYSRIRKLTPQMLGDLVDHIVVHDAKKIDGITEQYIDIHYRDIGSIEIPDVLLIPQTNVEISTRQGVTLKYGT